MELIDEKRSCREQSGRFFYIAVYTIYNKRKKTDLLQPEKERDMNGEKTNGKADVFW